MLKRIDPLLTPDLLHALAAMGHGDRIAVVDANFPATALARRLIPIPGNDATAVLRAVLSLLPVDELADEAAITMAQVDPTAPVPDAVRDFASVLASEGAPAAMPVERYRFYELARAAFAIVPTGERRLYGNIILTKGVVRLDT